MTTIKKTISTFAMAAVTWIPSSWCPQPIQPPPPIQAASPSYNGQVYCPMVLSPVCGANGVTYENTCIAQFQHGVPVLHAGDCSRPQFAPAFPLANTPLPAPAWEGINYYVPAPSGMPSWMGCDPNIDNCSGQYPRIIRPY